MQTALQACLRPFLLMEGGPFYRLQKHIGLVTENPQRVQFRATVSALFTFVPLFILSALQHHAFAHVEVPFVRDFSAYSRFLLAIPLLILAENITGPRIACAAAQFVEGGLVPKADYGRFSDFIDRGLRARDSTVAEIVIIVLSYVLAFIGFRSTSVHVSTWYLTRSPSGNDLTWAGWWLVAFCAPFFQFLIYRWLYRLFLWFQFLSRVRKLDLQLFPTHPDEAGGLGFVGETQRFFGIFLFAISVGTTGVLANDIVYDKIPLHQFTTAILVYAVLAVLVLVAPLLLFSGTLFRLKRNGLHQYAGLATAYTGAFHHKWIQHNRGEDDQLLGSSDIQSLADLGNSFNLIEKLKPVPIELRALLHLFASALLPLTPLLLAVMPLKEILRLALKLLM